MDIGRWCVVGRFASIALRKSRLRVDALSLNPEQDYLVFDFWREEYVGRARAAIDCPALELGHCQILALRPALDRPQFLSSTRHVSQDAVSVEAQSWADNKLALRLEGVSGTTETYWIHAPKGFEVDAITGHGLSVVAGKTTFDAADGYALAIDVTFPPGAQDRTKGMLTVSFGTKKRRRRAVRPPVEGS
jgi:hypothetical protein